MNHPFVWLGSGRAKKRGVGHKGRLLDEATKAGLPVPHGGVLLDEFYQLALASGVIALDNARITIADPTWLHETLYQEVRFPRLKKPVAVRPAFSAVENADDSLNGLFASKLSVDFYDPRQLADSLSAVWSSALAHKEALRRDVLVMEMVNAEVTGAALTEAAVADDVVNYTAVPVMIGRSLLLSKSRAWRSAGQKLPTFARRLQKLLRGVRRTFGQGNWRIEWLDDGRICWLIQASLIAR